MIFVFGTQTYSTPHCCSLRGRRTRAHNEGGAVLGRSGREQGGFLCMRRAMECPKVNLGHFPAEKEIVQPRTEERRGGMKRRGDLGRTAIAVLGRGGVAGGTTLIFGGGRGVREPPISLLHRTR